MPTCSNWSTRRVLVTGGAGFIGSALTRALVDLGCEVAVIDDLSSGRIQNLSPILEQIEWIEASILDPRACLDSCRDRSIVFHLAALGSVPRSLAHPALYLKTNVAGTANVFEACRDQGVPSVVFASSSSVYGDSSEAVRREGEEGRVLSPYALSKQVTEQLAKLFSQCYGMKLVALRYFNIYGPGQRADSEYAAVIPRFLKAALDGVELVVHGDGHQTRDFTFVSDAVEATLLAADVSRNETGTVVNVGAGGSTTIHDLAKMVIDLTKSSSKIVHAAPRIGDVSRATAAVSRLRREIGFVPQVGIAEGLGLTLASHRVDPDLTSFLGSAVTDSAL